MSDKRIAIIGAGNSGICGFKACREQGFDVVVYERTDRIGGLWFYKDEPLEGNASIWRTTRLNTSKEMTAFSDQPPPKEYPNFMHSSHMTEYLVSHANKIGFKDYLKLEHEIIRCEPNDDYDLSGKWKLTLKDLKHNYSFDEVFDGVMVCIGHNNKPVIPTFKDQELFKGTVIHSHSYKNNKQYENKNVVVIGIGNSSADISTELSFVTKNLYLSTRTGSWICSRNGWQGLPIDSCFLRRCVNTSFQLTPYPISCIIAETYLNMRFNHELYGLKPKHRPFSQHITMNDVLPSRIIQGSILVKDDIEKFTENGIIFKGENEETLCDAVVLCTGYEISYPFLSEKLIPISKENLNLYKFVFYPELTHPKTLAFISLSLPAGAIMPLAELQCRWFALLMANKVELPTAKKMRKAIEKRDRFVKKRYANPVKHSLECDWISSMDELADIIGVKPNLFKYFFTDPKLWWRLFFGPSLPYQYRLKGPNSWSEARDAIIMSPDRITAPFHGRKTIE